MPFNRFVNSRPRSESRRRQMVFLWAIAGMLLVVLAVLQPEFLLAGCDRIGYAVCHQIPDRSFPLGERTMPLCARCTGTFLGVSLGLVSVFARRRTRAAQVPPPIVLIWLALFFAIWAGDGINSYLALLGLPHLYEPHNALRLVTGLLLGLSLSNLAYPVASLTIWQQPGAEQPIANGRELLELILLSAVVAGLVLTPWPPFRYLLTLISAAGVLAILMLIILIIVVVVMGRENSAQRWRDLCLPAVIALALTVAVIAAINMLRFHLTAAIGLPF